MSTKQVRHWQVVTSRSDVLLVLVWITFSFSSPLPNRGFYPFAHSHPLIVTTLGEMTDADKAMNTQHFGSDPADTPEDAD